MNTQQVSSLIYTTTLQLDSITNCHGNSSYIHVHAYTVNSRVLETEKKCKTVRQQKHK